MTPRVRRIAAATLTVGLVLVPLSESSVRLMFAGGVANTGRSLMLATLISYTPSDVPPSLSSTVYATVAVPNQLSVGVKVIVLPTFETVPLPEVSEYVLSVRSVRYCSAPVARLIAVLVSTSVSFETTFIDAA